MWRVIITQNKNAAYNMAMDEAFVLLRSSGLTPPIFRLFTWQPYAVSIGYSQKINKAISLTKCKSAGYDYVRRWTGGRAVLHNDEITYSVIGNALEDNLGTNIADTYNKISLALNYGLNSLGVKSQLSRQKEAHNIDKTSELAPPCFSSTAKYEIEYLGKKIVGSAQRRYKNMVLQHGSILLNGPKDALIDVLPFSNNAVKEKYHKMLLDNTLAISEILGNKVNFTTAIPHFIKGMEKIFYDEFKISKITDEEEKLINKLAQIKYSTDEWNIHQKDITKNIDTIEELYEKL